MGIHLSVNKNTKQKKNPAFKEQYQQNWSSLYFSWSVMTYKLPSYLI